ncbi:Gfo/Idh/MocA family protein [Prauserella cavernicola]|uniref:Gfo/Idh/MocA family oxidoreductase n=1 Tax=Prauserella cavernicola TaxID=2800127 RepID=A0A934V7D5_9PSEU|nr:Gfo/Idh/MocA family oxidoreductase [Prauserella cavernicola]MBK1788472.1 Gfo/Idh/MocA family oxidoreductase [Prauserella cavernicola]
MEPLRIGVLGAARIAESAIAVPADAAGHRLVAVAARDRSRAEDFAARHGVERVLENYADVLADPEVEVVYNPLANGLHGPWNLAAVRAGKHVLSEKPFACDPAEAAEVFDAARRAGVTVLPAYHYLHHPVTRRLLELLGSGELGQLRAVETDTVIAAPPDDDPRWSLELAGGALMDVGCYGLHLHQLLASWAGGAPRVLGARAGERAGRPGVDEWLDATLDFPGGATGALRCHLAGEDMRFAARLTGSRGEAVAASFVRPDLDDAVTITTGEGTRTEHLGRRSSFAYQLDALAEHLRTGTPLPVDDVHELATTRLVDDCYRAAGLPPRPRSTVRVR